MDLDGRRVLVTGASRGIGEALAEEVGGTAHPVDLADPTQVATFLHRVEDEGGAVDVLVNNAGIELTELALTGVPHRRKGD